MAESLLKFKEIAPFTQELGVEILKRSADGVIIALPADFRYQNRKGDIHGGALSAVFDTTMGYCACEGYADGTAASTLALSISFLSAGRGRIICTARPLRRGRSIVFVSADITDEQGQVVATATANFKVFLPK